MDFALTADQREIQALARDVAQAEIEPNAAAWDRDHRLPRRALPQAGRAGPAGRLRSGRAGGAGADFLSYILVLEESPRADAGVGVTVAVHTSACTLPILAFGTEEQRQRFVPPLARGETIGAPPRSPSRRPARWAARTRATRTATAGRLRARKQWITNGSYAGTFLTFARSEPDGRGRTRRLGLPPPSPSTRVTREEEKPGSLSSTVDLVIEGARVVLTGSCTRRSWLHDRDVDARRRPDRDRGTGARDRAGRIRRRSRVREGAEDVRQGDRRAPGDPVQARGHVDRDRRGTAARLPSRVAERAGSEPHTEAGAKAKLFVSEMARRQTGRRSRFSVATATRRSSRSSATTATPRSPRSTRARARSSGS